MLSFVALMYFTGKLVPERVLNAMIAQRDRLIVSQDERIKEQGQTIVVLRENNSLLLNQGQVTTQVVAAIPGAVGSEATS